MLEGEVTRVGVNRERLAAAWDEAATGWRDAVARTYHEGLVLPLDEQMVNLQSLLEDLGPVLDAAVRAMEDKR